MYSDHRGAFGQVEIGGTIKTLTLVSPGIFRPEPTTLRQMEVADEYPQVSLFEDTLNSDILNERYLRNANRAVHKLLPMSVSQILEAYFAQRSYDAVISYTERLGIPFSLLLKITGVRIPHVAIFSWISPWKKALPLRLVHSHIDRLILGSRVQREFAINKLGFPASKIAAVNWGVDQKFWRPMEAETDMICSAGREMRDFPTLLEAMRGLDIKCHISGSTLRYTADKVHFDLPPNVTMGRKSFVELRALYARSRFIVVPLLASDTDQGTTAITEAMAMGKAVVCTKTKGQVGLVEDGRTGITVAPGDPRALREAISHLWSHPLEAKRMGTEGRKYVEKHHRVDQFVNGVKAVVEDVIAQHRARSARNRM